MIKSRFFFFFLFTSFLLVSCIERPSDFPERPEHPKYILELEQTGFSETEKDGECLTEFGIQLALKPKYDSLPPIYYWTCDWHNYGYLDSAFRDYNLYFPSHGGCDINYEIFTSLGKNDALLLTTVIGRNGRIEDFENPQFRFYYHVLDTTEISFSEILFSDSTASLKKESLLAEKEHTVWSNILSLKRMSTPITYGFDEAGLASNVQNFVFELDSSISSPAPKDL